jgi:hypothetical protein
MIHLSEMEVLDRLEYLVNWVGKYHIPQPYSGLIINMFITTSGVFEDIPPEKSKELILKYLTVFDKDQRETK